MVEKSGAHKHNSDFIPSLWTQAEVKEVDGSLQG